MDSSASTHGFIRLRCNVHTMPRVSNGTLGGVEVCIAKACTALPSSSSASNRQVPSAYISHWSMLSLSGTVKEMEQDGYEVDARPPAFPPYSTDRVKRVTVGIESVACKRCGHDRLDHDRYNYECIYMHLSGMYQLL
jgi:hypothetical protein